MPVAPPSVSFTDITEDIACHRRCMNLLGKFCSGMVIVKNSDEHLCGLYTYAQTACDNMIYQPDAVYLQVLYIVAGIFASLELASPS